MISTPASRPSAREEIASLLARHDRAGPRYTSYPTAVEFHDGVGAGEYELRLRAAREPRDAPLAMYVHLPFCEERCRFCGCHVIATRRRDVAEPYLDMVAREAELVASRLGQRRAIAQLHLGGGTPTYYSPRQLQRLVGGLLRLFPLLPDAELALEADPRVTTPAHLDALAEVGFNRISFGVQDFDPRVQAAIGRVQTVGQTAALMEHARRRGFRGINVDLIYGLPFQTEESFDATLREVIALAPDRAAVYSFAFVPWMRAHQKALDTAALPSAGEKLALLALTRERLLGANFDPIGMDHFARPDDELARARREGRLRRNFQGYAVVPGDDVIGLGISAIGDVRGAYVQNEKKLSAYGQAVAAGRLPVVRGVLRTADDDLRRDVIGQLMCNFRLDVAAVERRHGVVFAEVFGPELELLRGEEREGLVRIGADGIEATAAGEMFVRNLAMCFDRYHRERHAASAAPVFSRTV